MQTKYQQKQSEKEKEKDKRRIKSRRHLQQKQIIQQQINDPNLSWQSNQEFVVERIIGEEIWDGEKYYLIKWKGYAINLSTWEKASDYAEMSNILNDYMRTKKGKRNKTIREDANKLMNPYRATEIHGHFLYGDQPKDILRSLIQFDCTGKKTIYLEVSWKPRVIYENSTEKYVELQNSILDSNIIFEHDPQFLFNYYGKNLRLLNPEPRAQTMSQQ